MPLARQIDEGLGWEEKGLRSVGTVPEPAKATNWGAISGSPNVKPLHIAVNLSLTVAVSRTQRPQSARTNRNPVQERGDPAPPQTSETFWKSGLAARKAALDKVARRGDDRRPRIRWPLKKTVSFQGDGLRYERKRR